MVIQRWRVRTWLGKPDNLEWLSVIEHIGNILISKNLIRYIWKVKTNSIHLKGKKTRTRNVQTTTGIPNASEAPTNISQANACEKKQIQQIHDDDDEIGEKSMYT